MKAPDDIYYLTTGSRPSKLRWLLWLAIVLLILVCITMGGAYLQAQGYLSEFSSGDKAPVVISAKQELGKLPTHTKNTSTPVARGTKTFLLMGSDRRGGSGYGRSDTMIVLRFNQDTGKIVTFSIPRDMEYQGAKINAVYAYKGPAGAIEAIRDMFEIQIDHFAVIDFRGFRDLVDVFGGVSMPIDARYYNKNIGTASTNYSDIDINPGYQSLDGADALAWVRYRHTDSDFVRAARQAIFIAEAKKELSKHKNIKDLEKMIAALAPSITSDMDNPIRILPLLWSLSKVDDVDIKRIELKLVSSGGTNYRLVESEIERIHQEMRKFLTRASSSNYQEVDEQEKFEVNLLSKEKKLGVAKNDDNDHMQRDHIRINTQDLKFPCQAVFVGALSRITTNEYRYQGSPATAISVSSNQGAGEYYLWQYIAKKELDVLQGAYEYKTVKGKQIRYYSRNDKPWMIATETAGGWLWLQNTLSQKLTEDEISSAFLSCLNNRVL